MIEAAVCEAQDIKISYLEKFTGEKLGLFEVQGTGVLLAGQSQAALKMAAKVIESAVPSDCKQCYLHIKV